MQPENKGAKNITLERSLKQEITKVQQFLYDIKNGNKDIITPINFIQLNIFQYFNRFSKKCSEFCFKMRFLFNYFDTTK